MYNVNMINTNLKEITMKESITNGIKHHFSAGDLIKWYPKDSFFHYYGDVIRVNKKTITIRLEYTGEITRVSPSELNWD